MTSSTHLIQLAAAFSSSIFQHLSCVSCVCYTHTHTLCLSSAIDRYELVAKCISTALRAACHLFYYSVIHWQYLLLFVNEVILDMSHISLISPISIVWCNRLQCQSLSKNIPFVVLLSFVVWWRVISQIKANLSP